MGAIVYQLIGGFAIDRGLPATDLKAATALIVILFIAVNNFSPNGIRLAGKEAK